MNTHNLTTKTLEGREWQTPVRFFIYDPDAIAGEENDNPELNDYGDIVETDLRGFLEAAGEISIEQNTIFANGVSQIVLTKMPKG